MPRVTFAAGVEDLGDSINTVGLVVFWTAEGLACLVAVVALIRLSRDWQWMGFSDKPLWDWLQLLIVPVVLTVGGLWFASQQEERQQDIEDERVQAIAYQAYIDQMSHLLTEENLSESPEDEVRMVARAQTLNVLGAVEGDRKMHILQFLAENDLVQGDDPIVDLGTADFIGARFLERLS
jgi:hypothetical protein